MKQVLIDSLAYFINIILCSLKACCNRLFSYNNYVQLHQPGKNTRAYVALFGGLSFMSFAAIFIKASHAPGIVTAFYRMAIASLVLTVPFLFSLRKLEYILPKKGVFLAILAGICFGCDMSLWSTGVVYSNATIPTLTANLAPLWVGFGSVLIFRHRLKPGFWTGLVIAIAGMFLLIRRNVTGDATISIGALLGVGAGMFYGAFYLASERGRKLLNTIQFLFISTLSSAVWLCLLVVLFGYKFTGYDQNTWLIFLGISLGVQVCGWFLINYSQGYLPSTAVAPTLLGQPVITFFLAAVLLNERLSLWHIICGLVVVTGIYIVHYSRNKL